MDPTGRWADPTQDAFARVVADPGAFCRRLAGAGLVAPDPGWLALWTRAEAQVAALAEAHLSEAPWCEAHLIRDLMEPLPAGDGLLCANSLPIRQLDTWSGTRAAPLEVFGNRGASGIDGQASTLAGLNAAGVPTLGLLGDLSLAHDLSGLLLGQPAAPPPGRAEQWRGPHLRLPAPARSAGLRGPVAHAPGPRPGGAGRRASVCPTVG